MRTRSPTPGAWARSSAAASAPARHCSAACRCSMSTRCWEMVERHRINFFSGVPTVYAALLQQPVEGHDVGSLEYGLCGAAPMPPELMRGFQERTGLKILEGYGLTEGTCVSTVNPPH